MFKKLRRKLVLVSELEEHLYITLLEEFIQKESFAHKSWNKLDHKRSLRAMHNLLSEKLGLPLFFDQHNQYKENQKLKFKLTFIEEEKNA